MKTIKINRKIFSVVILLIYACLVVFRCAYVPLDSDSASNVLITNDLLQGNFFLSDWQLSTGLGLTTGFLYYLVGVALTGISKWGFYIAAGLMIAVTVITGLCLCQPSKRTTSSLVFYLLICALPGAFADFSFHYHLGGIIWSLFSLLFATKEFEQHDYKNLSLMSITLFLGCFGDAMVFPIAPIPILIYCLVKRFSKDCDSDEVNTCRRIFLAVMMALLLNVILKQVYFYIGQVGKPVPMVKTLSFAPWEKLGENITSYIRSIFVIGDADFFGKPVFGKRIADSAGGVFSSILRGEIHLAVKTPAYFVHTIVIIIGFLLVFRNIRDFIRGRDADRLSVLLAMGIVCISLLSVITTVSPNARYLAYIWIAFGVLIVRNWEWLTSSTCLTAKSAAIGLLLMAVLAFGSRVTGDCIEVARSDGFPEPPQKALGEFLRNHGLEEGYSSFWNASVTTVALKNQVKVRALNNNEKLEPYIWLCKHAWYKEPANFIIAMDDDMFGVTPQNVIRQFGRPKNILGFRSWKILLYDKDLSTLLSLRR